MRRWGTHVLYFFDASGGKPGIELQQEAWGAEASDCHAHLWSNISFTLQLVIIRDYRVNSDSGDIGLCNSEVMLRLIMYCNFLKP